MSKIIGVSTANIDNISGLGTGGGGYDPVAATGTFTETVPTSGLLRVGGHRNDTASGHRFGPTPKVLYSSDEDGKYLCAQLSSATTWTKIAVFGYGLTNENGTYAINSSGQLWGIGYNSNYGPSTWSQITQTGISSTGWTDIDSAGNTVLGINSGKLYYLGNKQYAGDGSGSSYVNWTQVGTDTDWVSISCGYQHSLAIKGVDNKVYATGSNSGGRTGQGTTSGSLTSWTLVSGTNFDNGTNEDITHIQAAYETSLIVQNGKAFFCGYNRYNQNAGLSSGQYSTPTQIGKDSGTFKTDWSHGYAGGYTCHIIDTSGRCWWAGAGNYGAGANGGTSNQNNGNFAQIGSDTNWQKINSSNNAFSNQMGFTAIKGGYGYYWGRNEYSNIIDSSNNPITTPTLIKSGTCSAVTGIIGSGPQWIVGSFS